MRAPPVEQLEDGLWSLPVTIPNNPLGYTLVYLFATPSGPVLVDTGWNDPESWQQLTGGIAETGHDIADVYGVLVTHVHPDHHGLSERVRLASGAWVAMHPEDAWLVSMRRSSDDAWLVQSAAVMLQAGASEAELGELPTAEQLQMGTPDLPSVPTRLFADGDVVDVPGWTVRAIWTPGHSPGHSCFLIEGSALLLSGDHVLPRITPHVGLYNSATETDPLGDYLDSLHRLESEDVRMVLPAHLHRFDDLAGRLASLVGHHEDRLEAIQKSLAGGEATLWEITAAMPWNREWEDIHPVMKRAALSEAHAHVRYLERRDKVEQVPGRWPTSYRLCVATPVGPAHGS